MSSGQFSISGKWEPATGGYLQDQTTDLAYPVSTEKEVRGKMGISAVASPFTQLVLSVANIGFRALRVISFYHFWKEDQKESEYQFKARALEAGKDTLRAIGQPFAYVAFGVISIIGLFNPYNAMRAYFHCEQMFYGRPFMAQLLNFAPIDYTPETGGQVDGEGRFSTSDDDFSSGADHMFDGPAQDTTIPTILTTTYDGDASSEFRLQPPKADGDLPDPFRNDDDDISSVSSEPASPIVSDDDDFDPNLTSVFPPVLDIGGDDEDPLALIVPTKTLEEKIDAVIKEVTSHRLFSTQTLARDCMDALADHIVESYRGGSFEEFYEEQKGILLEQTKRNFRPAMIKDDTIYANIAKKLVDQALADDSPAVFERFKGVEAIQGKIAAELNNRFIKLNIENLNEFEDSYLSLVALADQMEIDPEAMGTVKKAIAEKYQKTFRDVLTALMTGSPNDQLILNIPILETLIDTLDDDARDTVLSELLKIHFNPNNAEKFAVYFVDDDLIQNRLNALKSIASSPPQTDSILHAFTEMVNTALAYIDQEKPTTPYQHYFHIQVRLIMEAAAQKIYDPLQAVEFDLQDPDQAALNSGLRQAVTRINALFDLDIELKFNMKIQHDGLTALLNQLFPEQATNVRQWIDSRPETYDFAGFEAWLREDERYNMSLELLLGDAEQTIDNLYLKYQQLS